jgi:hydrogenase maturation protease
MRANVPPTGPKYLVIGYGNTLRSDDGAGVRVADAVAEWELPGLAAISVQQLTPEIATALAGAERVVFVDARLARAGDEIAMSRVLPESSPRLTGHLSDPRSIMALAELLEGRSPEAWLIAVPAVEISLGEGLSATAARGVEAACARIRRILDVASS